MSYCKIQYKNQDLLIMTNNPHKHFNQPKWVFTALRSVASVYFTVFFIRLRDFHRQKVTLIDIGLAELETDKHYIHF